MCERRETATMFLTWSSPSASKGGSSFLPSLSAHDQRASGASTHLILSLSLSVLLFFPHCDLFPPSISLSFLPFLSFLDLPLLTISSSPFLFSRDALSRLWLFVSSSPFLFLLMLFLVSGCSFLRLPFFSLILFLFVAYFLPNMKRKKLDELQQFPLPKSCRQRRSGGTKPRTEFVDSAWSSSGSSLEMFICKDDMTTRTASLCQETCQPVVAVKKQMKRFDSVHSILEVAAELVPFTNLSSSRLPKVASDSQTKFFSNTNNRSSRELTVLICRSKEEDNNGKFDADFSSKVVDCTPDGVKQEIDGSESIQALCGNISAVSFLDWVKTTDMLRTPLQFHESPAVASGSASCSSRSEEESDERGRGKRKRKPKLHFDETTFSAKSIKKLRRLRIMRYLGLVAPPGSPFSADVHVKTDCRSRRVLKV